MSATQVIKQIIFDMDGTLADTAKVTIPACAEVSARLNLPPLSDESIRAAIGFANPDFYFKLYPNLTPETVLAFGEAVEEAEERIVWTMGEGILFPGILALLQALRARGIRMHVASTGDQGHVDAVLQTAGIEDFFTTISCGAPEKVDMVAGIISPGDPAHFAMVGDKEHDLRAARGNGIMAVAALFGYCTDAAGFDHALKTPAELLALV